MNQAFIMPVLKLYSVKMIKDAWFIFEVKLASKS